MVCWLPNIADFFFSLARLIEDLERQLSSASYEVVHELGGETVLELSSEAVLEFSGEAVHELSSEAVP